MMEFYTLNDGSTLPKIGFGTYTEDFSDNTEAIKTAIACGYRFFDTASLYETERCLGTAITQSGLPRSEFIIETKLWTDEMGYDNAKKALERSLKRLGTDYVDIYMIHWPRQTGAFDEDWKTLDLDTWRAMEEMVDEGTVKRLGVSNFLPHHLDNLLANCRIKPVAAQLELHPGYSQEGVLSYLKDKDILPMAWSPLGHGKTGGSDLLLKLSEKYGRSIPEICLRFLLQKGILPIPKATGEAHIKANLNVFDFSLSQDDVSLISYMPQNIWLGEHPDFMIPQRKSNPDNI